MRTAESAHYVDENEPRWSAAWGWAFSRPWPSRESPGSLGVAGRLEAVLAGMIRLSGSTAFTWKGKALAGGTRPWEACCYAFGEGHAGP
jgi:hypothetical protein